jgi:hypothetical protein
VPAVRLRCEEFGRDARILCGRGGGVRKAEKHRCLTGGAVRAWFGHVESQPRANRSAHTSPPSKSSDLAKPFRTDRLTRELLKEAEKMKITLFMVFVLLSQSLSFAIELQKIPHRVIADKRLHLRDTADKRICVWTELPLKIEPLLHEFGITRADNVVLKKGEVFAVFLDDRIGEDLVQITRNKTADEYFADYASAEEKIKLNKPSEGKKFTHITVVVFAPPSIPKTLGIRCMIADGASEKISEEPVDPSGLARHHGRHSRLLQ